MELLDPGTQIDAEGLRVAGTLGGTLRIEQRLTDLPHGDLYRGRFESHPVLVTFVDPVLAAQADVRSWLLRNIARASSVEHRNLLGQHGTLIQGRRCFIVQASPDGQTARSLLADRTARGKAVDRDAAQTIVGHVCNALAALHQVTVHGYVNLDTVWISSSGRVLLSDPGVGALLSRMRRFERMRSSGRLPNVAPEQLLAPPPMSPGTDVFGAATLLIELLTGRPLPEAGVPMRALGLFGPDDLVMCLERATAPDAGARPPDVTTFKAELGDALGGGVALDLRPPDGTAWHAAPPSGSIADPRLQRGLPPPPPPGRSPPPPPGQAAAMMPGQPVAMMPGQPVAMMPGQPAMMMMPGQPAMMMMMPPGTVVPPGYGVVGVPMAGPGGVPTMVPMLVSMQGAAAAPDPSASPSSATARARARANEGSDAMRELDRATRRIASTAPADAVLELTEDVSQSATRLAAEPGDAVGASASSLRLDLRSAEEAADRLETLDGAAVPEPVGSDPTPLPAADDAFFPSFAAPDPSSESAAAPAGARRGTVAIDDDDVEQAARAYRILRDDVPTAEYPLGALMAMIQRGELRATDTLLHPLTQRRLKVIDVPELRGELARTPVASVGRPIPTATPVAQRPMLVQQSRGLGGTSLWIALATAAFAAVGVWLWWRANGG